MATIIDALLVTVGLDTSGYKKGEKEIDRSIDKTKERAAKGSKEIAESGKRGAEFFTGMRNEALKFAAALMSIRGIANFVGQITKLDTTTGRLAPHIGLAVDQLSTLENLVERYGGTAADVDADMQSLAENLNKWKIDGKPPAEFFAALSQLHIDPSKMSKGWDVTKEKLDLVHQGLSKVRPELQYILGGMLGIGRKSIDMFSDKNYPRLFAEMHAINSLDERGKKLADERLQSWVTFTNVLEGVKRSILSDLQEPLKGVLETMGEIAKKFPQFYKDARLFVADRIEDVANAAAEVKKAAEGSIKSPYGTAVMKSLDAIGDAAKTAKDNVTSSLDSPYGSAVGRGLRAVGNYRAPVARRGVSGVIGQGGGAPEAAIVGKVDKPTNEIIQAILTAAQYNRDAVLRTMDLYREMVAPNQRANFDAVLRNQGLYGANAGTAGGSPITVTNNIGTIQVNAPNATDARGIGAALRPVLTNDALARQANSGLQ